MKLLPMGMHTLLRSAFWGQYIKFSCICDCNIYTSSLLLLPINDIGCLSFGGKRVSQLHIPWHFLCHFLPKISCHLPIFWDRGWNQGLPGYWWDRHASCHITCPCNFIFCHSATWWCTWDSCWRSFSPLMISQQNAERWTKTMAAVN